MGFKSWIRKGIGLAGKHAMNFLNGATGGLAGTIVDKVTDVMNNNGGIIGKVAGKLGRKFLSQKTRDRLSKFADKALDYLPDSKIKSALTKINDAAQGKNQSPPIRALPQPQTPRALTYDENTTGVDTEAKKPRRRRREPPPSSSVAIPMKYETITEKVKRRGVTTRRPRNGGAPSVSHES